MAVPEDANVILIEDDTVKKAGGKKHLTKKRSFHCDWISLIDPIPYKWK